ncbi:hypothetical protein R3P38DRAFT_3573516 [Favolaschia claudopus]|uniref:K Homology domain-containing protein n=1 Tax=Favolaschia claudopus TaxID=2862362 RepID=A0AAW0ANG9_9AGAR
MTSSDFLCLQDIMLFVIDLAPGPFSPYSITNLLFDSGTLLTLQPLLPEGMPGASPGMALAGAEPSTPAPTPAIIAVGHTAIPLAETLPTAQDAPSRYSCTLVVPDSVVGHIVGRGGKALHQSHDISGAQLRAYTDKASPLERRVSIRGTDQQIGEALIALGKHFMRKRIRSKKKGPSCLSGDPAPPPPGPVPVLPNVSGEGARPLKKRAHPVHPSQPPAPVPPPPAASAQPHPGAATQPRKSGVRFAPGNFEGPPSAPQQAKNSIQAT